MSKGLKLPHVGAYIRLRPSKIQDIGVFALKI